MRAFGYLMIVGMTVPLAACRTGPSDTARSETPAGIAQEAAAIIRDHALNADGKQFAERLLATNSAPRSSDPPAAIRELLAAYGDPHASFMTAAEAATWRQGRSGTAGPASAATDPAAAARSTPEIPTRPWGKMLDLRTGLIGLPPCATGEPDALADYARACRSLLADLAAQGATQWVIDLRLNGGGNVWPMLVGMQPLLGDGAMFRSLQPRGAHQTFGLRGGEGWMEFGGQRDVHYSLTAPQTPSRDLSSDRVAVLIGPWTMSSGEMLTIAFLTRDETRTFGEPSGGLTTITGFFPLSDGSVLVLPTGRAATRDGREFLGKIEPHTPVRFSSWPTAEDEVVRAAARWLSA